MRTLYKSIVSMPLSVLGLIANAHSRFDPDAPMFGSGDVGQLAHGVTVGLDLWTATQDKTEVQGFGNVDCVRLSLRKGFHSSTPEPQIDYYLPFSSLREKLDIDLTFADEAE
jgi:hypothetical protein